MASMVERIPPIRAFRELRRDFDRLVLVLAAGDLVANFGFALVFPFLTIYLVGTLEATAAQAGLVTALYSVCSIVSGAAGGWLADRVGRRRVMIVSVATTSVVIALMGRATDLVQIAALSVVLGIVDPAFVPAARAAVTDVVPEERRARAFGLLSVANAVGWIAGPAIGAGLASLGYDVLFLAAGILVGSFAVIAFFWLPETLGRSAAPSRSGETTTAAIEAGAAEGDARRHMVVAGGWATTGAAPGEPPVVLGLEPPVAPRHLHASTADPGDASSRPDTSTRPATADREHANLRRRAFAAFLVIALVAQGSIFLWVSVLPVHAARDLGITPGTWGLLFSLNGILIVLFQLRISTAAEGRRQTSVMAGGMVLYATAMAIVAAAQQPAWAVAAFAAAVTVLTCGEMLFYPTEAAFVSELSPPDGRGRYQGFLLAATGAGTALGPPIGGYVLDAAPGAPLWLGASALFLGCAAALAALGRVTRDLPSVEAS